MHDKDSYLDYIYLVIGLIIIFLALLFSKKLGNRPVSLNLEKIGFNLTADRLTLFYLLGFIVIGVGVFFKFKGYETRLGSLEQELKSSGTVREQLNALKEYDFDMFLEFDTTLHVSPQDESLRYFIDRSRPGEIDMDPIIPKFSDVGSTYIHVEHLKSGESFKIIVKKSNEEQWGSETIEVPNAKIKLKKVK